MEKLMSRIIDQRYRTWEGHPTDPMKDPNLSVGQSAYDNNKDIQDNMMTFLEATRNVMGNERLALPEEYVAQASLILGYLYQAENAHNYKAITGILESISNYPDRAVSQAIQF